MKKSMFLTVVVLIFLLCGCKSGVEEEEKVSITLLHGFGGESSEDILMRKIYAEFEEKNTDISITLVSVPSFGQVLEKAKDLLVVGKAPNIIYNGNSNAGTVYKFMVEKGYALDLMPYIEGDEELRKNISDYILKYWKNADNTLYTVTDVLETRGYWYNNEIFGLAKISEEPENYEAFVKTVEKINAWAKKERIPTVAVQLTDRLISTLMSVKGGEDEVKKLAAINDFIAKNQIKEVEAIYKDELRSFNVGHSAMYFGEVFEKRDITGNMDANFVSFLSGGAGKSYQVSANSGYIISNWGSNAQEEASIRFIKYMLSREVQEQLLTELFKLPSNPNVDIGLVKSRDREVYDAYMEVLGKNNPS